MADAGTLTGMPVAKDKPKVARSARGRPNDDPDVRHSKTLSYILRHGAAKEGLKLRPDGFIRVEELVRCRLLLQRPLLTLKYAAQEAQAQGVRPVYAAEDRLERR